MTEHAADAEITLTIEQMFEWDHYFNRWDNRRRITRQAIHEANRSGRPVVVRSPSGRVLRHVLPADE